MGRSKSGERGGIEWGDAPFLKFTDPSLKTTMFVYLYNGLIGF